MDPVSYINWLIKVNPSAERLGVHSLADAGEYLSLDMSSVVLFRAGQEHAPFTTDDIRKVARLLAVPWKTLNWVQHPTIWERLSLTRRDANFVIRESVALEGYHGYREQTPASISPTALNLESILESGRMNRDRMTYCAECDVDYVGSRCNGWGHKDV